MHKVLTAFVLLLPISAHAQSAYEPPSADNPSQDEAPLGDSNEDPLANGIESLLNDLFRDVEPHMNAIGRELGSRVEALAPLLEDAGNLMDDIRNYQAPERLANGDILIRRKADAPPPPPVSKQFQELTKPSPDMDPRLNPAPDALPDAMRGPEVEL